MKTLKFSLSPSNTYQIVLLCHVAWSRNQHRCRCGIHISPFWPQVESFFLRSAKDNMCRRILCKDAMSALDRRRHPIERPKFLRRMWWPNRLRTNNTEHIRQLRMAKFVGRNVLNKSYHVNWFYFFRWGLRCRFHPLLSCPALSTNSCRKLRKAIDQDLNHSLRSSQSVRSFRSVRSLRPSRSFRLLSSCRLPRSLDRLIEEQPLPTIWPSRGSHDLYLMPLCALFRRNCKGRWSALCGGGSWLLTSRNDSLNTFLELNTKELQSLARCWCRFE